MQAEAGDMTIGLGVLLLNLHNPVYVAETVASMDVICRGRLVFGVGLGYRDVEFDAFGVPKGQRVRRFEECLELVRRLWTEESVSHDSDLTRLREVRMNLRPVQDPHPPIWLAANTDPAVRRAARLGDAWFINPHATTATIRRQIDVYNDEHARSGKQPPAERPALKEVFCARDRTEAIRIAGPYLAGKYRDYAQWGQDQVMPEDEDFSQPLDELQEDRFVLGSPEECYEQLRPYWQELGVNHLVIRTHWAGMPAEDAMASMRLISDELLPELHKI
jgi:alkanesulfonate monooxygenase SsuD/methylene tetrahydromethanopterin reductase-like flavin-dependent oxidoreductase (luciferase family)